MSNDDQLDFIDDESSQKKPTAKKTGGFDPFAGTKINTDENAHTAPPPARKASKKKSGNVDPFAGVAVSKDEPVAPTTAPDPSAAPADFDDDVQPGSGKDLWTCPHCGAKNKPNRTTCRSCGKSADEEVSKPVWQNPAILYGLPVLLILVFISTMMVGGPDLTLKPAGTVDAYMSMIDDDQQMEITIAGGTFVSQGRFSVAGRILDIKGSEITVVYGSEVADDTYFSKLRRKDDKLECDLFHGQKPTDASEGFIAVLRDHGSETPNGKKGDYISVIGSYGKPEGVKDPKKNYYHVVIDGSALQD